jgi:hypothetical protein
MPLNSAHFSEILRGTDFHYKAEDPYRSIAASMILQGIQDTRAGYLVAQEWLAWDGYFWLDLMDIDYDPPGFLVWVYAGCP